MDIATAKPSLEERAGVLHHFIDICLPTETYSAGDYEKEGLAILDTIFQKNNVAIAVGGSGFFIRALAEGLDVFPEISNTTKDLVENLLSEDGLENAQRILAERDPVFFEKIDKNNPARLRRALEVCLETNQAYSTFFGKKKNERNFDCIYLLLEWPRADLYERINRRVDLMVEAGLEAEARKFFHLKHYPALQTVGYSEWFEHFEGKLSRVDAIDKIKQHSRNYAKRQGTWFRKHGAWTAFHPKQEAEIQDFLKKQIKKS